MAQYRIVRKKGCEGNFGHHFVQKKVLGLFWKTVRGGSFFYDKYDCELYIKSIIRDIERNRQNPKDIVIAEYEVR